MLHYLPVVILCLCIGGIRAAESPGPDASDPATKPASPAVAPLESITLSDGRVMIGVLDEKARTITTYSGTMVAVIPLGGATVVARAPATTKDLAPAVADAAAKAARNDAFGVSQADLNALTSSQKRLHEAMAIKAAAEEDISSASNELAGLRQRLSVQVLSAFPLDLAGIAPKPLANETTGALTARLQAITAYNTLMTEIRAWRDGETAKAPPTRTGTKTRPQTPMELLRALNTPATIAISDQLGKPRILPILTP